MKEASVRCAVLLFVHQVYYLEVNGVILSEPVFRCLEGLVTVPVIDVEVTNTLPGKKRSCH